MFTISKNYHFWEASLYLAYSSNLLWICIMFRKDLCTVKEMSGIIWLEGKSYEMNFFDVDFDTSLGRWIKSWFAHGAKEGLEGPKYPTNSIKEKWMNNAALFLSYAEYYASTKLRINQLAISIRCFKPIGKTKIFYNNNCWKHWIFEIMVLFVIWKR